MLGLVDCGRVWALSSNRLKATRIAAQFSRKKLNRHAAPQLEVLCLVYHPHAAAADDFEHSIMRNLFADEAGRKPGQRHGSWLVTTGSLRRRFQPLNRDH